MIDMNESVQEVVKQCVEIVQDEINMKIPKIIYNIIEEANINTKKQISIATKDFENLIRKIVKEELNNINHQSNSYYNNKITSKEIERLKRKYGSMTADGWVMYINEDEGERLYKIRLDGTENTQLTTGKIWTVDNVENGWIYYTDVNHQKKKVRLE